jgi:hypothetical protein
MIANNPASGPKRGAGGRDPACFFNSGNRRIPNRGEQMMRYYGFCNTVRYYSSNGNAYLNSIPCVAEL